MCVRLLVLLVVSVSRPFTCRKTKWTHWKLPDGLWPVSLGRWKQFRLPLFRCRFSVFVSTVRVSFWIRFSLWIKWPALDGQSEPLKAKARPRRCRSPWPYLSNKGRGYNGSRRTILSDQSRQSSQPLMHCAHSKLISAPIAWPTICLLQKLVAVIRLQFPSTGEHDWLPYYVGCPVDNSGFILCGIFLVKVFALLSFLKEIRRIASSRARWPWVTVVNSQVLRVDCA